MRSTSRQYRSFKSVWKPGLLAIAAAAAIASPLALPAESGLVSAMDDPPGLLMHSSQGYLGVTIHDIDPGRATELKLKDVRGAEIVMLDHDAPACKAGMKVHDVIVQMNGETIEGIEQLRRMLHETPAGRTVNFVVWRDGQPLPLTVQLGDRAEIAREAIINQFSVPDPGDQASDGDWVPMFNQQDGRMGSGFFGSMTVNPLYVGVALDPVGAQLAGYFGVKNGTGLLVKSVDDNSPASAAGMKAGDVVLKVNEKTMVNSNDWLRAIHSNRGKQVQVTVLRNHKEQTLTMTAGLAKRKG